MYRLFTGPTKVLGVKDGRLNQKGMEGRTDSLERGTPGYIPNAQNGRNREVSSWEAELRIALEPYEVRFDELPVELRRALERRRCFTLVEGVNPIGVYNNRIDADDLIHRLLRHDQSTLAVQQLRLYATHNGRILNQNRPLSLEPIPPFPGFEQPIVCEIPETLPDEAGRPQSTTQSSQKPAGRLTLHTSRDNMWRAHKELRSRWRVSYRAGVNMIGSKPVSELVPTTPGKEFVYATVELAALEPDYVALGRVRPNEGPLVQALDLFVGDQIRQLAKQINEQRRQDLDETQLDEVQVENRKLDEFKNQFLPDVYTAGGDGPNPGEGDGESEVQTIITDPPPRENDTEIVDLEVARPTDRATRVARGVSLKLSSLFRPRAIGPTGHVVPRVRFNWSSNDRHVVEIINNDTAVARGKGTADLRVEIPSKALSVTIPIEIWQIDHVLLTPRNLQVELGKRKQVIAEVTNDEGMRATDVLLNWRHDADDQLIVRINLTGWVTGNRLGHTNITAGAGSESEGGVWARIQAEVEVIPSDEEIQQGTGFPSLLLTGRDIDPEDGQIRQGDPEQPALWQEVSDFRNNVWWLNLEQPAALDHFSQRAERPELWRSYHAQKLVEMVQQVHMKAEYTQLQEGERPDVWAGHKATLERIETQLIQMMWERLKLYVANGEGLD